MFSKANFHLSGSGGRFPTSLALRPGLCIFPQGRCRHFERGLVQGDQPKVGDGERGQFGVGESFQLRSKLRAVSEA